MIYLSIIIPVYNAENNLRKCLDSILNNNLIKDFEVILINDGSNDSSASICKDYSQKFENITFIDQTNQGVSKSRNIGLSRSKGKYITFIDSDDYVEKDYIQNILNIVNNVDSDVYIFNSYIIDNVKYKNNKSVKFNKDFVNGENDMRSVKKLLFSAKLNAPWDKVYRADIIKNNKIQFPEHLNLGEDFVFQLQYFLHVRKSYFLSKKLYNYQLNSSGLSGNSKSKKGIIAYKYLFKEILRFCEKDEYVEYRQLALITELQIITNYIGNLYRCGCSSKEIIQLFKDSSWYQDLINSNYHDFKSNLRRLLLKYRFYFLISLLFHK